MRDIDKRKATMTAAVILDVANRVVEKVSGPTSPETKLAIYNATMKILQEVNNVR